MTKKERTNIFNLCVIIFNIAIGLTVELVVLGCIMLMLKANPNLGETMPMQVILPILLLAGLFVAMSLSIRTISWVIQKFNLADKLDQKVVSRYQKKL